MSHLITGLICVVVGAWGVIEWWDDLGEFLRGAVPIGLVLLGLAALGSCVKSMGTEAEEDDATSEEDVGDPAGEQS